MSQDKRANEAPQSQGEEITESGSYTFDLAPGQRVRLTIEALPAENEGAEDLESVSTITVTVNSQIVSEQPFIEDPATKKVLQAPLQANLLRRAQQYLSMRIGLWKYPLPTTLFAAGLVIYLLTRLIGLSEYPIYFFTDEAVQTNLAADFLRDNFRSYEGEFFPTYFQNVTYYNLSLSVYAQVLPTLFLGKSIFVTRSVSVVLGLLAPLSIGLILRDHLKIRYWWTGVLVIAITPAWFLHSRTAFETSMFVGLYAVFIYYYYRYRKEEPQHLYAALALGSLAFYTYSPGRFVVVLTGALLLLSDLRYHWQNRSTGFRGLVLLGLFTLPQIRFEVTHPDTTFGQLRLLASYWAFDIPITEKLGLFLQEYVSGMSPLYWFGTNTPDLARHLMGNLGHILPIMLPFWVIGLILAFRHIRAPVYRILLIAWLAAPSGAALAQIGITRALVYVFPASLLITLGLNQVLIWLEGRWKLGTVGQFTTFSLLAVGNFALLATALTNGPTWESNYGLGGMQYGAKQVYAAVQRYAKEYPDTMIVISPIWANGADILANFFIPEDAQVTFSLASIDSYLQSYRPEVENNTVLVMTPEEYQKAVDSEKFEEIQVEQTLPYPDGSNGFYFLRVRYTPEIDAILEAERLSRKELVESEILFQGEPILVRHSLLDMGNAGHWFDQDRFSVARTLEANPLVIEFALQQTSEFSGITVVTGSSLVDVNLFLFEDPGGEPVIINFEGRGDVEDPALEHDFSTTTANFVRLEIRDLTQGDIGNVHLWEVELHTP